MTTQSPRPLGARRALLLFLAYVAVQFGTGIAAGIFVAIWCAVTLGLRTPGVVAEAMRSATILGAIFGMIAGGWVVYRMVLRAAAPAEGTHRLAPLGWAPSTLRPALAAVLTGVVLAALCLLAMDAFPPPPGVRPGLLGVTRLKGQVVGVIDLRIKLGLPHASQGSQPKIVILELTAGAHQYLAGFVADRISDVVIYRDRDLRSGALRGKGRPRRLVDFDQRVSEAELAGLWALTP